MYHALDIAAWFIAKNDADQIDHDDFEYEGITNMKVQKLLYFAQGIGYSLFGTQLFQEDILAWEHGPVVWETYIVFSKFGRNSIVLEEVPEVDTSAIGAIELDQKVRKILLDVYNCMNIYTASELRNISHEHGGPWDRVYKRGVTTNVIPLDEHFVEYFKKNFEEE